jgi:hypothetical protein
VLPQTGVGRNAERKCNKRRLCFWWSLLLYLGGKMDLLKKSAVEFDKLLSTVYYFEIARKNVMKKFMLNFKPEDFHHISGLHKLADIGLVQTAARGKIYNAIMDNLITFSDISISKYYPMISDRMKLVCQMENVLDSNQIVFKYLEKTNKFSRIEADYLFENAHKMDIIYIFLSERMKMDKSECPIMCCRSCFPMDKVDYSKNQPSYTLLKKVKIDTITGNKILQYDRSKIIEESKKAVSESERKSILQQLNEKKAQQAISDILSEKRRKQQDHTRF